MVYVLVIHTVEDFEKWKTVYDEHATKRSEAGCKGDTIYQSEDNGNEIVVLLEWDTIENARAFASSEDVKQAMEKAGVTGEPIIRYLDQAAVEAQ